MVRARKYVIKNHFQGVPKRSDFELVEYELPPLQNGEVLVKAEWISVDPYLRLLHYTHQVPYDVYGFQVALVLESKNAKYPVGSRVVTHKGWSDYSIFDENEIVFFGGYVLPDLKGLPNELGVGAVGMPGATAYFGLLEICQPKSGETVVVTGAAGAVGTIVGQIAKIKGCRVIGFAGSDDKVKYLEKELGFDKAINYKTADVDAALKAAAPEGVDCYFDNVGGELSSIIISQMNEFGRVAVCGVISAYNYDVKQLPKATIIQHSLLMKQIKVEGFLIGRWFRPKNRWPEAFTDLVKWIKSGQIKVNNHVTEGFDNVYDAFVGMMAGNNLGKAVVKV